MRTNLLIALLAIFGFVLPPLAPAATVTLQNGAMGYVGVEDSYITGLPLHANRNFGKSIQLGAGTSGNRGRVKTLIRFDLSKLGPFTAVTAAKLKLSLEFAEAIGTTPMVINLYRLSAVNKDWKAGSGTNFVSPTENGTACWNHRQYQNFNIPPQGQDCASMGNPERCPGPAGIDWGQTTYGKVGAKGLAAGTDYDATPVATATVAADAADNSAVELVFTGGFDILKDWAATPANNAGFLLDVPAGNGAVWVNSSEVTASTIRPALELTGDFVVNLKGVAFKLATAGYVSMLIQDQNNNTVKELAAAKQMGAGDHAEYWDGTDNQGAKVPDGTYKWKLVQRPELSAEYLMSLGLSTKFPYPGNHNPVTGFTMDANHIYAVSGSVEGPPIAVKMTQDGSRSVREIGSGALGPFAGLQAASADGGRVFLLKSGTASDGTQTLYRYDSNLVRKGSASVASVLDLKAHAGKLAVINASGLTWLSVDSLKPVGSIAGAFKGAGIDNQGNALVISGSKVVKYTGANPVDLITTNLVTPIRLDVCPDNGDILVVDGDKDAAVPGPMQVKRFGSDGQFKAAYGKAGGRALVGPYDKTSFTFMTYTQIECAGDGSFWLNELLVPARIAHFSASGQWLKDFYGGMSYANPGVPDPDDPTVAYIFGPAFQDKMLEVKIDYAAKNYEIVNIWPSKLADLHRPVGFRFIKIGTRKFLCNTGAGVGAVEESGKLSCGELDRASWTIKPRFAHYMWNQWGGAPNNPGANLLPSHITPPSEGRPWSCAWADLNGDGLSSQNEFRWVQSFPSAQGIGPDGSLYLPWAGGAKEFGPVNLAFVRVPPEGITAGGAPIWPEFDWHAPGPTWEKVGTLPADVYAGLGSTTDALVGDGLVWMVMHGELGEVGGGFWGGRIKGARVLIYDTAGNFKSSTGSHNVGGAPNGTMNYPDYSTGPAFGVVAISDVDGYAHLWDSAGLFIGRFPDITTCRDQHCMFGENFQGRLVPITAANAAPGLQAGDALYFQGSPNSTSVFRMAGFNTFHRQYGTITLAGGQITTDLLWTEGTLPPTRANPPSPGSVKTAPTLSIQPARTGTVEFHIPPGQARTVSLEIYGSDGRKIATLPAAQNSGKLAWDASAQPRGVYVARLATEAGSIARQFVLVK